MQSGHRDGIWHRKLCPAGKEKRQTTPEWTELNYQIKTKFEGSKKETCKYLGVLEAKTIKQMEMKEKIKEYLRRTRKLLEAKQYSRNLNKGINIWTVLLARC